MWILPSRSRPHNIERLVSHWGTTACWLRVDEDDPLLGMYQGLKLPKSWTLEIKPRQILSEIYNEDYQRFHDGFYGFIADDVVPETEHWDTTLIEVAGRDGMAVPKGGHEDFSGAPHFVLGEDLVKSVGWLALPGLSRLYIDTIWNKIATDRGVFRMTDVILRHHHFSNGLALFDKTYRKSAEIKANDRRLYENWLQENP